MQMDRKQNQQEQGFSHVPNTLVPPLPVPVGSPPLMIAKSVKLREAFIGSLHALDHEIRNDPVKDSTGVVSSLCELVEVLACL